MEPGRDGIRAIGLADTAADGSVIGHGTRDKAVPDKSGFPRQDIARCRRSPSRIIKDSGTFPLC